MPWSCKAVQNVAHTLMPWSCQAAQKVSHKLMHLLVAASSGEESGKYRPKRASALRQRECREK
eukprot:scaffold31326_cov15-Tisochrysis_lutea.AAC.1